jgi:hypothetical protein
MITGLLRRSAQIIAISELAAERRRKSRIEAELLRRQHPVSASASPILATGVARTRAGALLYQCLNALRPRGAHDDINLVFSVPKVLHAQQNDDGTEGTDNGAGDDEEALGALFRGMPSLSPAARAQLAGTHLSPGTATTPRARRAEPESQTASDEEREASESKVMPLARLFGQVSFPKPKPKPKAAAAPSTTPQRPASPYRRPETPIPATATASAASTLPDDVGERLDGLEASMRRIEEALQALTRAQPSRMQRMATEAEDSD